MMKQILYLGTDPKSFSHKGNVTHFPIIQTVVRDLDTVAVSHYFNDIVEYTHFIFTSKNAVRHFFEALTHYQIDPIKSKQVLAIGKVTAKALEEYDLSPTEIANPETQEGLIYLLRFIPTEGTYIFYPRSSLARSNLEHALIRRHFRHQVCNLYDTKPVLHKSLPNLDHFDEIIFTSPSTVQAFQQLFGSFPINKTLTPIGSITKKALTFMI